jgi:signal transduction histidine kinase
MIVAEGRRAAAIVTRIRSFLKKTPAERDALDVGEIVDEAAQLVERELSKDDIGLTIRIEPGLPKVRGDRVQLQQVLVNLMVNAGHAMSGQGAPRMVTISADCTGGDSLTIVVKDTGPGIAQADLPRLFQPFFTTKQDGMGMGLAICRTTMEAHGGQLSVDSAPGAGATFRLTLPVLEKNASQ